MFITKILPVMLEWISKKNVRIETSTKKMEFTYTKSIDTKKKSEC